MPTIERRLGARFLLALLVRFAAILSAFVAWRWSVDSMSTVEPPGVLPLLHGPSAFAACAATVAIAGCVEALWADILTPHSTA